MAGRRQADVHEQRSHGLHGRQGICRRYHGLDVNYVCNTRDDAFLKTIAEQYPNITVAEVGGFSSPNEAAQITSALLTKYPNVKGIFVSYSTPCIDVLQTVKALGRTDIKIVTMDLDTTCALDMAQGGNIVGIATAVVTGGPGALFWMWMAALFGMVTKFSEGLLAVKYRTTDKNGHVLGGPFYYIENGMGPKWRWLAKVFAFFGMCVGLFGIGTFTQVNSISSAVVGFFDPNNAYMVTVPLIGVEISVAAIIGGLITAIFAALVIIGGVKRIAHVSERVVPGMVVVFLLFSFTLIIFNIDKIPAAFYTIITHAFGLQAFGGGMLGAILIAMQLGLARGIFANEAGLGSAPIAAAAAQTREPARQGLVSMTQTFIDSIIICSMTGLALVLTDTYEIGLEGAAVTTAAFQAGLPFLPPEVVSFILMVCLALFGFTTILGWNYYGERCRAGVSLALHRLHLHRPVHDGLCCVDHRRHLQRVHGGAQHDRPVRAVGRGGQGGPGLLPSPQGRRRRREQDGGARRRCRRLEDPQTGGRGSVGAGYLHTSFPGTAIL